MNVEIVPAQKEHIIDLMANMRERERQAYTADLQAVTRLRSAIDFSAEAWSGYIDGQIVCMWGIDRGTMLTNNAFIWLITCNAIEEHPFIFVRHSKRRLDELCQRYNYIHGIVQVDNEMSVKWLRWLGFKFGEVEVIGEYVLRRFSKVS